MPRWQRVYLAACSGVIGFAIAYSICEYAGWPRLLYDSLERDFYLGAPPIARHAVTYWGLLLFGAAGAAIGGAGAWSLAGLSRRPLSDRWVRIVGAWALTAVALAGAFFTWSLWPFG